MADTDKLKLTLEIPRDAFPAGGEAHYYTQENCHLLGLKKRQYLELLRRPGAPEVTKIGNLRLVKREDFEEFRARIRQAEQQRRQARRGGDGDEKPDSADEVLAEVGAAPRKDV